MANYYSDAELDQMIAQLEDERRLTTWERSFIESASAQYGDSGYLSTPQCKSLKTIYDKYNN